MNAHSSQQQISVDEWRELERNSHDVKHEYIDGRVYAMSGGSLNHSRISLNACFALENAILAAGKQCYVYNSDAATRLSSKRYTYPDASVTCSDQDQPTGKREIRFPSVIIEVLSESTEAYDRGKKFGYYQACSYIQEYVLIDTEYQAVEVFRRASHLWTYQAYGPSDEIELTSIGVRIPFAAFYRNSSVLERIDDTEGEV